ncbi:MAG: hypothetical protein LUC30_07310 [Clostridiales bacterium]|nr:hypothetical protein [Clostridiales bacterium]
MSDNYKPIKSMKEVPDQLRKLRREYIRYQQAELIYSLSHKKLQNIFEACLRSQRKVEGEYDG